MSYYEELINIIKQKKPDKQKLSRLKTRLCKKHKLNDIPTDIQVLLNTPKEDIAKVKKFLLTKPTRSLSGVAIVAIMSKPHDCPHGRCHICPGGLDSEFGDVPQSYTGKEPATRRAIRNDFDPYLQVINRLEQYIVTGHVPEKVELIVMGGTFPSLDITYQEGFIASSFKAMNDFSDMFYQKSGLNIKKFKDFFELPGDINDKERGARIKKKLKSTKAALVKEQTRNEKAKIKCIGLTLETRPDYAFLEHANEMLKLGCTRVELGVQTVYQKALDIIGRGHSVLDSINATRILKDLGFKINYHMMPGLPGISYDEDINGLVELFASENFRPDMLKIYPCMVLKGTKLYDDYIKKEYTPLTTEKASDLIKEFKEYVPEYVRIMRVQRDIPTFMTEAGVDRTNLRQLLGKTKCRCIRCREIGSENFTDYEIKVMDYDASDGKEFFISAESNDKIIGFCRMRYPSLTLRKEITKDSALIRELHVYGESTSLGEKGPTQHKGIGKALLKEAEKIAGNRKMVVISGVGAREYYKKLGYKKEGPYMVRFLK